MSAPLTSILYREWRERRTGLLAGCIWVAVCIIYIVFYDKSHAFRAPVASFYNCVTLYGMLAAIWIAMRTALGEETQGTIHFSLALPISRERLAAVKLLGGAATLILPILLGAILLTPLFLSGFLEQAAERNSGSSEYIQLLRRESLSPIHAVAFLWRVTAIATSGALSYLLVLAVVGTWLRRETNIGFVGVLLAVLCLISPGLGITYPGYGLWFGAICPFSLAISWGYGEAKGSYTDLEVVSNWLAPLVLNAVSVACLVLMFRGRYAVALPNRKSTRPTLWQRRPAILASIPIPFPNRFAALVWINLRQSIPLAVAGLVLAIMLTGIELFGESNGEAFRSTLPSNAWFVGVIWAIVVGTGIFASELRDGLRDFWQSRPISLSAWYWVKFFVGMTAILLVLDATTILASWGTPIGHTSGMSWSYVACMPLMHVFTYTIAVLAITVLRRPIPAGLVAVMAFFILTIGLETINPDLEPLNIYNALLAHEMHRSFQWASPYYVWVYGGMAMLIVVSSLLGAVQMHRKTA